MTDGDRNSFRNLILLCHPHHTVVDRRGNTVHTIELLEEWKNIREAGGQEALAGLRNVTEDRLQELITEAISPSIRRVQDAISRLEAFDSEAAKVLRDLIDRLNNAQPFATPDEGIVNKLYQAGNNLHSMDEGIINNLYRATESLRIYMNEDAINRLSAAADRLSRARPDY